VPQMLFCYPVFVAVHVMVLLFSYLSRSTYKHTKVIK